MERAPNKSQHTKFTLEKKILLPLLPGFELTTFDHESGALTNKLSRLADVFTKNHSRCRIIPEYLEQKLTSSKQVFPIPDL